MENNISFEENMSNLEKIVAELEQGNIPLEKALSEFQKGVKISNELQNILENAEKTLAHEMTDDGNEIPYEKKESDD